MTNFLWARDLLRKKFIVSLASSICSLWEMWQKHPLLALNVPKINLLLGKSFVGFPPLKFTIHVIRLMFGRCGAKNVAYADVARRKARTVTEMFDNVLRADRWSEKLHKKDSISGGGSSSGNRVRKRFSLSHHPAFNEPTGIWWLRVDLFTLITTEIREQWQVQWRIKLQFRKEDSRLLHLYKFLLRIFRCITRNQSLILNWISSRADLIFNELRRKPEWMMAWLQLPWHVYVLEAVEMPRIKHSRSMDSCWSCLVFFWALFTNCISQCVSKCVFSMDSWGYSRGFSLSLKSRQIA